MIRSLRKGTRARDDWLAVVLALIIVAQVASTLDRRGDMEENAVETEDHDLLKEEAGVMNDVTAARTVMRDDAEIDETVIVTNVMTGTLNIVEKEIEEEAAVIEILLSVVKVPKKSVSVDKRLKQLA